MEITYSIILPFWHDDHRPYLDMMVEAHHKEKKVGRIRIEWVSSHLLGITLPTVWHYVEQFKGWSLGIIPEVSLEDPKALHHLWRRAFSYTVYGFRPPSQKEKGLSPGDDLKNCYPSMSEMVGDLDALAKYKGFYQAFAEFKASTDYVYVGYSKVDSGNHWPDAPTTDYRKRGIGTKLYQIVAMWLAAELDTSLHASTLRSDAAIGVWDNMVAQGFPIYLLRRPETNKQVLTLDYTMTPFLLARAKKVIAEIPRIKHAEKPTVWPLHFKPLTFN